jgi:anti-sigma B factor antagonist
MAFNERTTQGITIITADGRLTFTAGAELGRRIASLADANRRKVILNLERISYVDSAGLGAIVDAFTQLRHVEGTLKFVNPSARTRHVLAITGIATLVATFATEAAAVDSFAAVDGAIPTAATLNQTRVS